MRTNLYVGLIIVLLSSCLTAFSQQHYAVGGVRWHTLHSEFLELPFNKRDTTYLLGYEYHEGAGFWQLMLGYTPHVSRAPEDRNEGVDYVITPQINLIIDDRNWLGGVGILSSYIKTDLEDSEMDGWSDIYWQVMLGYSLNLGNIDVGLMVYYPFEKWSTFSDFKTRDLEFGFTVNYRFK